MQLIVNNLIHILNNLKFFFLNYEIIFQGLLLMNIRLITLKEVFKVCCIPLYFEMTFKPFGVWFLILSCTVIFIFKFHIINIG